MLYILAPQFGMQSIAHTTPIIVRTRSQRTLFYGAASSTCMFRFSRLRLSRSSSQRPVVTLANPDALVSPFELSKGAHLSVDAKRLVLVELDHLPPKQPELVEGTFAHSLHLLQRGFQYGGGGGGLMRFP